MTDAFLNMMLHFCLLLVDELNWLHYKAYLVSNLQFLVVAKTKLTVSSRLGVVVGLKQCSGCKNLPLPPRSPIPRSRSCYYDCFFCPKTEVLAPQKFIPQMSRVGQPQGKALSALATSSSSRSRWQCWPTRGQPSSHPPIYLICWSVDNKYKSKLANQLTNSQTAIAHCGQHRCEWSQGAVHSSGLDTRGGSNLVKWQPTQSQYYCIL